MTQDYLSGNWHVLIGIINVSILIFYYQWKFSQRSPFAMFPATILAFFVIPSLFDSSGTIISYHNFAEPIFLEPATLIRSQLFIMLFIIAWAVSDILLPRTRNVLPLQFGTDIGLFGFLPLLSVALIVVGSMFLGEEFSQLNFSASRDGTARIFSLATAYASILSIPLPAILFVRRKFLLMYATIAALLIPVMFFGGARQMFIISIVAVFFCATAGKPRGNWLFLVSFTALLPLADYIMSALKHIRNLPTLHERIAAIGNLSYLSSTEYIASSETAPRFVYYSIMQGKIIEDAGSFSYLVRTWLAWLPSFLDLMNWKPDDFEQKIFYSIMGGRAGTSHATIFGNVYADSGWIFLPWIMTLVLVVKIVERLIRESGRYAAIVFFFAFYMSVMWARGSLYAPVLMLLVLCLALFLINKLDLFIVKIRNYDEKDSLSSNFLPNQNKLLR